MLQRPLKPFERALPWLGLTAAACVLLTLFVLLVAAGVIPDPGGNEVKGYTYTGIVLGFLLVALSTLVFVYSLRKRALQEPLAHSGSMMMWLWMHVFVGGAALVVTVLHAGIGVMSWQFSSGKALFLVFVALIGSGILWRVLYAKVPPHAAPKIGNYSKAHSEERAAVRLLEIEKLAAGKSEAFRGLIDWCVTALPNEHELWQRSAGVPEAERADLERALELARSRARALDRARHQQRTTYLLQIWRVVHVPAAIAVVPLLLLHLCGATRLPGRLVALGTMPLQSLGTIAPSRECAPCHAAMYRQWQHSMHAHGVSSPVTLVQNNRVVREELDGAAEPDPKLICVNCHSPLGTALSGREPLLPWSRAGYDDELLMEGVGCTTCHQFVGTTAPGAAGLTPWQDGIDRSGNTYYGGITDPVGNAYHRSSTTPMFRREPERLCESCHNVVYDRNGDGVIEKGVDLVLQETTVEYFAYREQGGSPCFECHMRVLPETRAAESAVIPFEQTLPAPRRVVHDHSFVGVDYPLDEVAKADPHRGDRERLLRSAASLDARFIPEGLEVTIANTGTGHNLPTGLAFARQMWLEVTAFDLAGNRLAASGVIAGPSADLCDSATMTGSAAALARFVHGCAAPDPSLVNFQQFLASQIQIATGQDGQPLRNAKGDYVVVVHPNGDESELQRLAGGVVPRVRPADRQAMAPIEPRQSRAFRYGLPPGVTRVRVRLLFRSFPPYFLRALAAGQRPDEPQLLPLIDNLQIVEMAVREIRR
jgi:hypothetical protein